MHCSFWITIVVVYLSNQTFGLKIDDFSIKGTKNTLGHGRRCKNCEEMDGPGIKLLRKGSLTESLAPNKHGSINLTGKSIRVVYSSETDTTGLIIITKRHKHTRTTRNSLSVKYPKGKEMILDACEDEFYNTNFESVKAITVRGSVILHRIETVDEFPLDASNVYDDNADDTSSIQLPELLIDDFSQLPASLTNSLQFARHLSAAQISHASMVYLATRWDYISEYFAPEIKPLHLQYTAFKITYTLERDAQVSVGLYYIAETNREKLSVSEFTLAAGQSMTTLIPVSKLQLNHPANKVINGYGLVISGPIDLFRIELVMNMDEYRDILSLTTDKGHTQFSSNFIQKLTFFQNALQLIKLPGVFELTIYTSKALMEAHKAMTLESFRMELCVTFTSNDENTAIQHGSLQAKGSKEDVFFLVMNREIISSKYGLFERSKYIARGYVITPRPFVSQKFLEYYRFVGQILGKSLRIGRSRSVQYTTALYTFILNSKISLIEMLRILPIDGLDIPLDVVHAIAGRNTYEFVYNDVDDKFDAKTFEQVPDAYETSHVTDYCNVYVNRLIAKQLRAIRDGFYDVIPKSLVAHLGAYEFEIILGGSRCKRDFIRFGI